MRPDKVPEDDQLSKKLLSRRDVLKLGAVGAASLAIGPLVSACGGAAAQPTATSTPTASSVPTATSTPAATNTSTATRAPTATSAPAATSSGGSLDNSRTISTKDGRKICYLEAGKPDGIPVLVLHGSPGSRMHYDPWIEAAQSRGIRLISYDRPGYGGSTPQPGRSVASAVDDVATLATELGLGKFFVTGLSGGGPHALACAALLPDLVVAAAALASLAPYDAVGLDWWDGMGAASYDEFQAALKGRDALLNLLSAYPFYSLPPAEAAAFTEDVSNFFIGYNREATRNGLDGWVDDDIAFTTPWGFDLSQIQIPVMLMQGDQDWFVPFTHGKWLAGKIKNVETHFIPGEGHLAMLGHGPEVHAWLLSKME